MITVPEIAFLDRRVIKRSLPRIHPPVPTDAPELKRLMFPQGELAQFHDGRESIHYLAYVELVSGTTRGNHYHKSKRELIYVIAGGLNVVAEDIASRCRVTVPLELGDLVLIETEVAHALQVTRTGHAFEFSSARFDPADSYRYTLI